jgi:hypothetical protein
VVRTRILRTAAATLSHTFYAPGTETPTDPTGTPTYAITAADGTSVTSGNATATGGSSGVVTAPLAGQANLGLLTVAWTATVAGASVTEYDTVELVGGFFFTLAEARGSDASLADLERYPTLTLEWARAATEDELELICDRAFVPRFARVVLDGTGSSRIVLRHPDVGRSFRDLRVLRGVSMAEQVDTTFTAFTAAELADIAAAGDGTLRRSSGDVFTGGWSNVAVDYEYGLAGALGEDLKRAALTRFRTWCNIARSGIPDRATSYTTVDGTSYRIALPGAYATGLPDVDAVYSRYSLRMRTGTQAMGGGAVPAGRTYTYDPQPYSLYHRKWGDGRRVEPDSGQAGAGRRPGRAPRR